jgi:6-phosphogluconolactonase
LVRGLERRVEVHPDLARASRAAAAHLVGRAAASVREHGRFSWVISGGRTPLALYEILREEYRNSFPWGATEVFFADERCVPPDHADSNFGAAWSAFLSHVPIPRRQVHRLRGELRPAAEAAAQYSRWVGPPAPRGDPPRARFDVVLLGIGPDGHTASLFPGSPAVKELRRSVVSIRRSGLPPFVPRLTMTPPALSSAGEVCFLVAGADKAAAISGTFRSGPLGSLRWPASRIRPATPVHWFLDRAAATGVPRSAHR